MWPEASAGPHCEPPGLMKEPRNHSEGWVLNRRINSIDAKWILKCRGSYVGELITEEGVLEEAQ